MMRLFWFLCLITICNISYADIASVGYVDSVLSTKQNKLTAGDGITIASDGTISANVTTYETGTADTSGTTKLYENTGTNTDGTITQNAITTALGTKQDKLPNVPDGNETYGLAWDRNAGQFTFVRYIELPYASADSETSGVTKLYNTTGINTDGTMNQNAITTALTNKQDKLPTPPSGGKYNLVWDSNTGQFTFETMGE